MTAALFLGFVALMAALVATLSARYLQGRTRLIVLTALPAWLLYVGLLGYFGIIRNTSTRPPGIAFLFVPLLVFFVFFILRTQSQHSKLNIQNCPFPLWLLLGL